MSKLQPQAILVLPHLRVQNANAISSPLTHGFPSITAFTGLMWALQRKLAQAQIPLQLLSVGVVCHHHQEQVTQGYVRTFNLTRNPVDKDGSTAAIVEEGRMHLQVSLIFAVAEKLPSGAASVVVQGGEDRMADWAAQVGEIAAQMRVAGGSLLPSRPVPGKKCGLGWPSCQKTPISAFRPFVNGVVNGCRALPWWGATICWRIVWRICAKRWASQLAGCMAARLAL